MIGAAALYGRGSGQIGKFCDDAWEKAEAKPKTPAKKPQVSVPEPPAEAEPDPVLDPMPEEELEGLAGEILSLLQKQDVMHMDHIRSGTGSFYGGTDHHADRTGTVREIGTPAGKTIPVHALRLSCVCSLRTNLEKKQL